MSTPWHTRTASVAHHPRLSDLGRTDAEQARVQAFAADLAAWLAGAPRQELRPLARVVTAVGGPALRETRTICQGLPLLAVEAGARATAVLWPLLRDPPPPPDPPEAEDGDGQGEGGEEAGGAGGPGSGAASGVPVSGPPGEDGEAVAVGLARDEEAEPDDAPRDAEADAREVLAALADGADEGEPDLDALAKALAALGEDPGEALQEQLEPVGEHAWEGAKQSEELARTLESLVPGIGWGMAPGELHATLSRRLDALVSLLERLPELKRIVDRIGRAEADEARAAQQDGGSEEVTGVRLSGEVSGALPAELALLGDDDTEDLFYQRLLERRLVSLELSGRGLDGVASGRRKGPIIAAIDTSGSMQGAPEAAAKALVLATCRRALPQGRAVHLLLFGARGEATELRLRRGRGGLETLLDFLVLGFEGGTDFDTPLMRALELLEERDLAEADVLVVTDGYARAAPAVVRAVRTAREARGLRVWSVVLGTGGLDSVASFSDEVWSVDPEQGGTALGLHQRLSSPTRRG